MLSNFKIPLRYFQLCFIAGLSLILLSCTEASYPKEKLKEHLFDILKKEYGIHRIEVKFTGKTMGLYMPVDRLWTANLEPEKVVYLDTPFREIKDPLLVFLAKVTSWAPNQYWKAMNAMYGTQFFSGFQLNWVKEKFVQKEVNSIQEAIELHPDVQRQLGDILFTVSRVIRSTDMDLDFYQLQTTDTNTGHEFIISSYTEDVKRALLWDISREEYDRRLLRDTRVNTTAIIHSPIRNFFNDLNQTVFEEVKETYFTKSKEDSWVNEFYFVDSNGEKADISLVTWEVDEVKSFTFKGGNIFAYVKVDLVARDPQKLGFSVEEKEYLIDMVFDDNTASIRRIIPFDSIGNEIGDEDVKMDRDKLLTNIKDWNNEFQLDEIFLEDFIADQLTKRIKMLTYNDERIFNTFKEFDVTVLNQEEPEPHFSLNIIADFKEEKYQEIDNKVLHEDMLYILNIAFNDVANVLRSYRFDEFQYFRLNLEGEVDQWLFDKSELEVFRKGKKEIPEIIQPMPLKVAS